MKTIMLTIVVLLLIIFLPLSVIWALNTLFELTIHYGIDTWAAVMILTTILGAKASK